MVFLPLIILAVVGLAVWLRPWPFFLATDESSASTGQPAQRNVAGEFGKWVERQAHVRGLSVRGVARPVPIQCPKCNKVSNFFVYPDELCERCWSATLKPLPTSLKGDRL